MIKKLCCLIKWWRFFTKLVSIMPASLKMWNDQNNSAVSLNGYFFDHYSSHTTILFGTARIVCLPYAAAWLEPTLSCTRLGPFEGCSTHWATALNAKLWSGSFSTPENGTSLRDFLPFSNLRGHDASRPTTAWKVPLRIFHSKVVWS